MKEFFTLEEERQKAANNGICDIKCCKKLDMDNIRQKEILTIEEAETYLGIKKRTLYKLIKSGDIPAVKIGGQWRFSKARLDALFLEDNINGAKNDI